MMKSTPTRLP